MRLALFGATGTVGSAVLSHALSAGYEVRVLARRLTIVAGDALDPAAVTSTIVGCDAVLSSLGGVADPHSTAIWTGLPSDFPASSPAPAPAATAPDC